MELYMHLIDLDASFLILKEAIIINDQSFARAPDKRGYWR